MAFKKILIILSCSLPLLINAQNASDNNFTKAWQEIDSLLSTGKQHKVALTKVKQLYEKAFLAKQPAQKIKSLLYQYALEEEVTDKGYEAFVADLRGKISMEQDQAALGILQVLLAKNLYNYYSVHRWQLYDRKETVTTNKQDISTWSIGDFRNAITDAYLLALKQASILQQTPLQAYDPVIIRGNRLSPNTRLYDLVMREAIDFFKSGELYIDLPVETFLFNQETCLANLSVFTDTRFATPDSSNHNWITLQLYQQWLKAHVRDTDPSELIAIDLDRLNWVNENSLISKKNTLYENALKHITQTYPRNAAAAKAWYLLAREASSKADDYRAFEDTSHRWEYANAIRLVEQAMQYYDSTNLYWADLFNLREEIRRKTLSITIENANQPEKPMRVLVRYRNLDQLYVRVIQLKNKDAEKALAAGGQFWRKITTVGAYKKQTQTLPLPADYQIHSVEIKLDGLPVGEYGLLCSSTPDFNDSTGKLSFQKFQVTNLAYIKNRNDIFVVNRETGKPVAGAVLTVLKNTFVREYDKYEYRQVNQFTADANGHILFKDNQNNGYGLRYLYSTKNDRFLVDDNADYYSSAEYNEPDTDEARIRYEKNSKRIFFYTDRGIYRPGQVLYYKGIGIYTDYQTKLSKLIAAKETGWIYLKDRNGKKLDSARFVLNDYGSFNGSFKIPMQGLTGRFSLTTETSYNYSTIGFSVEEYKRPTYTVEIEKPKAAYRLNDSVQVTGYARAFAGNTIDGAKVVYRVRRAVRSYFPYYRIMPVPENSNREIVQGTLSTDAQGRFSIVFRASVDDINLSTWGRSNPQFSFTIDATVTDANGETRTASTNIIVARSAIQLNLEAPASSSNSALQQVKIKTTNLSQEPAAATVQLKLIPLKHPQRLIRKRLWDRPDLFAMGEEDFIRYFPHDEYAAESDPQNWQPEKPVQQITLNTAEHKSWQLATVQPGYYLIQAIAKDGFGEEVQAEQYITVYDQASNNLAYPTYLFSPDTRQTAEPGDTVRLLTATAAGQVYVIRKTIRGRGTKQNFEYISRNQGFSESLYYPAEEDRGDIAVADAYMIHNRLYTINYYIQVPWSNKKLAVQYSTYRNKTTPGSEERWSVIVKNNNNEKAAAELLTAMYDASLDQFASTNWSIPYLWPTLRISNTFDPGSSFRTTLSRENYIADKYYRSESYTIDRLATSGQELIELAWYRQVNDSALMLNVTMKKLKNAALQERVFARENGSVRKSVAMAAPPAPMADQNVVRIRGNSSAESDLSETILTAESTNKSTPDNPSVQVRKNFNETAFFIPQLYADSSGDFHFSFTMPESLTSWKWMSMAHTKDLAFGSAQATVITQKTLMVQANAPRFMREGDKMEFSAKISNLDSIELSGQISLELIDATTGTSVDGWFQNVFPKQYFTAEAGKSTSIKFPIQIPYSYNRPLTWRLVAKAGNFSDGEENTLPVLTNRILLTESMPILISGDTTRNFRFEKLINNNSPSLTHEGLTFTYTSNPIWYAIQSLPYLMEYPYECVEQTFNRFYANALGNYIVNRNPKIKKVFEAWQQDSSAFKHNLLLNEELKQIMIEETPWVLDAGTEDQKKQRLAMLFDVFRLNTQSEQLIQKLQQMQTAEGAFSWFKGGYPDRYMTTYVLTGIGKLKRLGALTPDIAIRLKGLIANAINYLDKQVQTDYQWLKQQKLDTVPGPISNTYTEYLFMRSFYPDILLANGYREGYNYYYNRGKTFLNKQSLYNIALLGTVYYRNNEKRFTNVNLLGPVLDKAITDKSNNTVYWKDRQTRYWYQSPVEHQSLLIQFLQEVQQEQYFSGGKEMIDQARNWLLLNKQSNDWNTTVATADACYTLLTTGSSDLDVEKRVTVKMGKISFSNQTEKTEAGTGYFKKRIPGTQVIPEMGNITIQVQSPGNTSGNKSLSWGSVFWQYFEESNRVTAATGTPLSVTKKLMVQRNTNKGVVLELLGEGQELKVGDKVIVRLELRSDRDMEYIHLKDTRAAGMEPVNVLSGYKWQDGLGYYESTRDASTNFFISNIRKGTYLFEYPVYITHTGVFSSGIATIQCMYAPEFTNHSTGSVIRVGE